MRPCPRRSSQRWTSRTTIASTRCTSRSRTSSAAPRADIKDRQCFYLPVLAESRAGTPDRAIVDVGCGRGEFLELMRDEGLTARGVDANESMVAACRDAGLDCVLDDAVGYLARQAPDSLGAVTGFHIIEHLPFKTMIRLFDEALRALAPGGVLVFETPNPANILTASRRFYLDPTHRNPLPHEMVAMVAEARGFTRISVVDLHPAMERFGGNDPVLRAELDRLFYGPQDYALLARKP
ncbi:MAG: class I SAM-dependent methyltransferase [Acetobacteraceae bacterium]